VPVCDKSVSLNKLLDKVKFVLLPVKFGFSVELATLLKFPIAVTFVAIIVACKEKFPNLSTALIR